MLEHYLRSEVHLDLDSAMLAGLSAQDHGFDARLTYQALEDICTEMAGFAIGPQMVIGTFPWAKLPLVTTYTGDVKGLAAHDVVAAGIGRQRDAASDWRRARQVEAFVTSPREGRDWFFEAGLVHTDTPTGTGGDYGYTQLEAGFTVAF